MGSRARRDQVLKGADPTEVWNSRIASLQYRVGTLGEVSREGWVTQQLGGYPGAAVRVRQALECLRWNDTQTHYRRQKAPRFLCRS